MFRTALRNLLAHKIRLFTTGLAVMLGVAFMAGTLVLTDTIGKTFDDLFADVYAGTDAVVRAEACVRGPQRLRRPAGAVDASLLDDVAAVDGVDQATGDVFGFAQARRPGRRADRQPRQRRRPPWGRTGRRPSSNPWTLVAGDPPTGDRRGGARCRASPTTPASRSATP